ncbi:MAG: dipicolinate synthase subunit B [Clostridia bacterium]|nr:dipicolinate synthase subunit B [Clostridia bacterium]
MIGYAFCGSFCTFRKSINVLSILVSKGLDIMPIMSENAYLTDTRFGRSEDFRKEIENICGRDIIHTITAAEPLGPAISLEALIISPCTGNTLAKIANGITDTSVTMASKAHLRSDRPLIIALASNDAMSANLKNIGTLLQKKNVFFVPMLQDDPKNKPHSLVADFSLLENALTEAIEGRQMRRLFN